MAATKENFPLIPVRMLNEFVYCPRLGYQMWVQGEFAPSADTVDGSIKHRRVDRKGGQPLPVAPEDEKPIHARSVSLSSEQLGITAKIDLVEGQGSTVRPVDYKRGKRPHVARGAYDPERVQLCAQGLLLREHGYTCEEGDLYFVASRERVPVVFDEELTALTREAVQRFREVARQGTIPAPLEDSPKCPRCSLVGICLPEEIRFLGQAGLPPRPIFAANEKGLPLYVQSPRAYVRKNGEQLIVEVEKEKVATVAYGDTSQVVLFGNAGLTTPALHECLVREIPVTWLSYGGWFMGHTVGTGHRNVETRTAQYRASFDPQTCLRLARRLVAGKIANCRTLLKRNWKGEKEPVGPSLAALRRGMGAAMRADALDTLLGIEGTAAGRYFANFAGMFSPQGDDAMVFDMAGRNRRPPRDPVNALLSFAYAMLTREWTVTLAAVGLDPYRGFYHQPRFGRPALALDMMEPFRPLLADSTVLMAINNGEVRMGDFVCAAGACNLSERGRKNFIAAFERRMNQEVTHPIFKYRLSYRRLLEVQARLLIRFLTGEIPAYPVFVTR
ncbi:CRISPR-associated endonuclease Cas4g/Cas1g [Geoalkalibacter halelectricus]|uniref:CRISPR-associated endonuclease Cas1 n=1 Tax=Geoalkalibacter halelectricus TaxID=2847045 RepID=A0ABY5ZNL1_9BACT|nr:CRISPR-associated endonuclease Cas1 [Geoalkalibacter halelectricus]MDO3377556.1 CRISPR-associated endonuclease Cas1 [Geoalkalibacter halelectricus]UWZ80686.1 CRISPR-associated endonuclease Cas1 [Geoalkalibacter halelectricus]